MSLIKNTGLVRLIAVFSLSLLFSSHLNAEAVEEVTPYSFYQGSEINVLDSSAPLLVRASRKCVYELSVPQNVARCSSL